jgi:Uma2 family endonuclease
LIGVLQPTDVAPQKIRPLKRSEYDRLVALGVFEDDRVELIRGNLVTMAPNDPEHASPIELLNTLLVLAVGARARVRVQLPIVASDESEPEPDLAIVPIDNHAARHPSTAHLIIEVAASSLKKDRQVKAPLYAASGFPEYWIVNVAARSIEVFRDPGDSGYRSESIHTSGSTIAPLAFPDIAIAVADLFPG